MTITRLREEMVNAMELKEQDTLLLEHAKLAYNKLKHDLRELDRIERETEAEYRQKKDEITQGRIALQSACPHLESKYHPDVSGNNDSWNECLLCRKQF